MVQEVREAWQFIDDQFALIQNNKGRFMQAEHYEVSLMMSHHIDMVDMMLEKKDRPMLDAKQLYFVPPHVSDLHNQTN